MPERRAHEIWHRLSWRQGLAVLSIWMLAAHATASINPVTAQTPAPSLEVVIPRNVFATEAGEVPFNLKLKYGSGVLQDTWFEIVTLPASISFSAGTLRSGVWRVPLSEAPSLRLKVPADVYGDGVIYVMLVDKGAVVSVATANLFISPRVGVQPAKPQATLPEPTGPAAGNPAIAATNLAKTPTVAANTKDKMASGGRSGPAAVGSSDSPTASQIASTSTAGPTLPNAPAARPTAMPAAPSPAVPATPPAQAAAPAAGPIAAAPAVAATAPALPAAATPPAPATTSLPSAAPVDAAPAGATQQAVASAASNTPSTPPKAAPAQPAPTQTALFAAKPSSATPQLQRLIAQGERNFTDGNISIARQYFAAAAELGSAIGAFKLAETNDPYELQKAQVVGLKIDTIEAMRWYGKAAELGMSEAAARVRRLQPR